MITLELAQKTMSSPPRIPSSKPTSSSTSSTAPSRTMLQGRSSSATICVITRAVQTMSSFHQTSLSNTARKYFYSPKHFPRILSGLMLTSGIAGYACMGCWQERQLEERKRIYTDAYHQNHGAARKELAPSPAATHATNSSSTKVSEGTSSSSNRMVALARKMTRRIVSTSSSSSSSASSNNTVLFNSSNNDASFKLQRQVTKFWW